MARSTIHYTDNETNNILKRLHNKLRPAGTPVQRVEYILELLLLRIFEIKVRQEDDFKPLRKLFDGENYHYLFSHLLNLTGEQIKTHLNQDIFPFYAQILSHARKVFEDNLPQKVQDNLVLIEEVFANSSFSTNVQSGNIKEIIGLIADIDETTILKTDILGDAIESALSEQGGTQEIGLYRTPEHIRQMMVAITDPTFDDIIFDPACGTGGFLFDAYHYVLEKVTKDGKWPSSKCPPSHPELNEYFKNYFQKFDEPMPDIDTANKFYREGVGGIEYLGMIRKMAAINLYIRGLNPANIIQGDSLAKFDPAIDTNSKTLILSNPPFGAEKDQPAYPNVWQEYSKESETTILFVKLMFDLLKKGGRCAVVVSEGFLTWDKASARAMRKMLLEEANLRAIISIPQGVFVSKQGQGAKTSILYFEKGKPTDWVWYYKIENDGFSMGVNRKPIDGCQISEVIELFHNYVKQSRIPPETKNSFIIPAEWIKNIDPRLKERIRQETKERILIKNQEKREKLIKELEEKKQRDKITDKEIKEKLWQFDSVLENTIKNETSKQIEKAHLYSFNLQTYRSDLTDEQIKEWQEVLKDIEPKNNSTLDEKYEALKIADEKLALETIAGLNPKSALEIDITREYVSKNQDKGEIFKKLNEILKRGHRYTLVPLGDYIIPIEDKIKPSNFPDTEFIILGVSNEIGVFINEKKKGSEINQSYYRVKKNHFCYNPYRINVGSIGLNLFDYENQIISGAYNVFGVKENELDPKFLLALFKTNGFLGYVKELATGGVRMDFKLDYLKNWKIPLPPLEVQQQIVEQIEKQKAIIDGADKILESWEVDFDRFKEYPAKNILDFAELNPSVELSNFTDDDEVSFVPMEAIDEIEGKIKTKITKKLKEVRKGYTPFKEGDVLFAKITPCMENGKSAVAQDLVNSIGFGTTELHIIRCHPNKATPKFIFYIIRTKHFRGLAKETMTGASGHKRVPESFLLNFKFPLPPLEVQKQIVEELDKEMEALEKVKLLKQKAKKRIEKILEEVWGEN